MADLISMRADAMAARKRIDSILSIDGELSVEQERELEQADPDMKIDFDLGEATPLTGSSWLLRPAASSWARSCAISPATAVAGPSISTSAPAAMSSATATWLITVGALPWSTAARTAAVDPSSSTAVSFAPGYGYFVADGWFGFGAAFGFLSCLAMVLFAKGLGFILKRDEDYYTAGDDDV